jgi:hypothetical protein
MKNRYNYMTTAIARLIHVLTLTLMCNAVLMAQGVFQSASSGPWSDSSTWQLLSGSDADGIPDTNDVVTIQASHTVSVGATSQDCAKLTINAGATLQITGTGNLSVWAPGSATVNGSLTMSNSGSLAKAGSGFDTLIVPTGGTLTISGSATSPAFDVYRLDPNSTFQYTYAGAQNVRADVTYGNLNLGGSGLKTAAPLPPDTTFRCAGTLTVGSGVTFDVSTKILWIILDGNVINSGTIDASVGITVLRMNGASWINNGTFLPATTLFGFGDSATATFNNTTIGGTPVSQSFYDLVIRGAVTAQNNLVAKRNITITPGATLNAGTGLSHSLSGNWNNCGSFVQGTSTVTFSSAATPQTIGYSTFYNLIMNNPNGVTLTGDVTIASGGTLTMTSGNISTGANTLTISSTDPAALVLGTNSISGTITRAIATGATGTYRLFSQNAYIIPCGTGNPTSITASAYPGTNPPNLPNASDTSRTAKRYYSTTAVGAGLGFTYTLRLPYLQTEVRGNEVTYALWQYNGSGWGNWGALFLDTTANFIEQVGIPSFLTWTIAENNAPLPIQLASFSAFANTLPGEVQLVWGTVSETNNFGFYIERSVGSPDAFVQIPGGFVPGSGTTIRPHQYSWTNKNVAEGVYYYRLNQVDLDGTHHFSPATRVAVQNEQAHSVTGITKAFSLGQNYPNPFNPSTEIGFTVEATDHATLIVYNSLGQEVAKLFDDIAVEGQDYTVRFEGTGLASGLYFCRLQSGKQSDMKRMVLLR